MKSEAKGKSETQPSPKEEKRELRKISLADSALSALREFGYTKTTMRDIAKKSGMSLGMLHYYFSDKDELILFCVTRFKDAFIENLASLARGASGDHKVIEALSSGLVLSLIRDADAHRLWYDMRLQAMYEPIFRPKVTAIELALRDLFSPLSPNDPAHLDRVYAAIDGLFRFFLQAMLHGENISPGSMEDSFQEAMRRLL